MKTLPNIEDLHVFVQVVKYSNFAKAADAMGKSPAYISKRIQQLEDTLNVKLLNRSTRHLNLTNHGSRIYTKSINLLVDMEGLVDSISEHSHIPSGSLVITSSLGFGRQHVAHVISEFSKVYPLVDIRFDTIDEVQDLIQTQTHLDIRIASQIGPNLIAKKLMDNKRILCAAPSYLEERGKPYYLEDLANHDCLLIKERDKAFGTWELDNDHGQRTIKVKGKLSSNNGEIVKKWALDGHGIILRSIWDVKQEIAEEKLIHILPTYWQTANIWGVYADRTNDSAKLRVCINFFQEHLPKFLKAD